MIIRARKEFLSHKENYRVVLTYLYDTYSMDKFITEHKNEAVLFASPLISQNKLALVNT